MTNNVLLITLALAQPLNQNCERIVVLPEDQPIVDDAFFRHYGRLTSEPRGYFAIVIRMGPNRCVHLSPRPLTLGPRPTYCYNDMGEMIASYGAR